MSENEGEFMFDDLSKSYEILEVEPGASLDEVKQAYHDMVWVWHPDRLPDDPRLQDKGHQKLKEINDAYEKIRNFIKTGKSQQRRTPFNQRQNSGQNRTDQQRPRENYDSTFSGRQEHHNTHEKTSWDDPYRGESVRKPWGRSRQKRFTIWVFYCVIVCLALNILLLSEQYNYNRIIEKLVKNPDLTQQRNAVVSQSEPADNPTVASENSIETIGFIDPQFKDDFFDLEKLEKDFDAITNPSVQHPKVFPGSPEQPNSIQVAALVTGVNSLPSSPLNILQKPRIPESRQEEPALSHEFRDQAFELGAQAEVVIQVQGEPDQIIRQPEQNRMIWKYGKSSVLISLSQGDVIGWDNRYQMLHVHMQPGEQTTGTPHFTTGSHRDDVIRLQGTPDVVSCYPDSGYEVWRYGYSTVVISTGNNRVINLSNSGNNLAVNSQRANQ